MKKSILIILIISMIIITSILYLYSQKFLKIEKSPQENIENNLKKLQQSKLPCNYKECEEYCRNNQQKCLDYCEENPSDTLCSYVNQYTRQSSEKQGSYYKFPSCGDKKELFAQSHIPISELQNIVPLGNLNPSGHTFPTNHLYFHLKGFRGESTSSAPIIAPGDILITRISSSEYTMKGQQIKDYKLGFTLCAEVRGYFIHLTSLSEKLLRNLGQPENCNEYDTGGIHYKNCDKDFYSSPISLIAGESIGTVGGSSDFGLSDLRTQELIYANPKRWDEEPLHRVCPLDYFTANVREQLKSLLGGEVKRTIEPICGEVAQDKPGTAQGVWFVKDTSDTYPEDPHLALVHDNVDPLKAVFSVGTSTSKSGLSSGAYYFVPKSSGLINRDFKDIKDNNIYCYETELRFGGKSSFIILIQLTTPTTLKIEKQNSYSCGNGPWLFSSSPIEFER